VLRFLPERETRYGAETSTNQRTVVQTTLVVRKTNEQLPVDYRLIEKDQRWRVYNMGPVKRVISTMKDGIANFGLSTVLRGGRESRWRNTP
jgi:hypothetical protein